MFDSARLEENKMIEEAAIRIRHIGKLNDKHKLDRYSTSLLKPTYCVLNCIFLTQPEPVRTKTNLHRTNDSDSLEHWQFLDKDDTSLHVFQIVAPETSVPKYYLHCYHNYSVYLFNISKHSHSHIRAIDFYMFKEEIFRKLIKDTAQWQQLNQILCYILSRLEMWTGGESSSFSSTVENYCPGVLNCYSFTKKICKSFLDLAPGICTNELCWNHHANNILDVLLDAFQTKKQSLEIKFECDEKIHNGIIHTEDVEKITICMNTLTVKPSKKEKGKIKRHKIDNAKNIEAGTVVAIAKVRKALAKRKIVDESDVEEEEEEEEEEYKTIPQKTVPIVVKPLKTIPRTGVGLRNWKYLMKEAASTNFASIRDEFGSCFEKKINNLELPIPIEMTTHHVGYGEVTLIAILWWIDDWDTSFAQPVQKDTTQLEYFTPDVDSDGAKIYTMGKEPRRICFFHSIQEIVGEAQYSPAACIIGKMFSSLHFSANLIGKGHDNGFDQWKILGTNVRLQSFIRPKEQLGAWKNFPDLVHLDVLFPGHSVPSVPSRDLMAVLCKDECNKFACDDMNPCKHDEKHAYELDILDASLEHKVAEQRKKRADERALRLSSKWGRAIWFEDATRKDVNYYFSWPGWCETFIRSELTRVHKRFFPHISLQLSFYYTFPESYLAGGQQQTDATDLAYSRTLLLLRYFRFHACENINGRMLKESKSGFVFDNENPLFMSTWKLDKLAWRLFAPIYVNAFIREESYGTMLRIPIRWQVLQRLFDNRVEFPLSQKHLDDVRNDQNNDNDDDEQQPISVFHQFLEMTTKNNPKEEITRRLVVSENALKLLHERFIATCEDTLKALEKRIKNSFAQLETCRIEYFEQTQFYNPGKLPEIDQKMRNRQIALDKTEAEYLQYCLAAACFKRANEVLEKGLMLRERELVTWHNDLRQAKMDQLNPYLDPKFNTPPAAVVS